MLVFLPFGGAGRRFAKRFLQSFDWWFDWVGEGHGWYSEPACNYHHVHLYFCCQFVYRCRQHVVNFGGGGRCGGAFLLWLETSWFVKLAGCWTGGAGGGFVGLPAISVVNYRQYLRSRQRQFLSLLLWPESRYGLDQTRGPVILGGEWRLRLQVYFRYPFFDCM